MTVLHVLLMALILTLLCMLISTWVICWRGMGTNKTVKSFMSELRNLLTDPDYYKVFVIAFVVFLCVSSGYAGIWNIFH